jgi:hypothetical protein
MNEPMEITLKHRCGHEAPTLTFSREKDLKRFTKEFASRDCLECGAAKAKK